MTSFADLRTGGRIMASSLESFRDLDDLVILGMVFGGVPVAREVALRLKAPMDLVVIRRLLMPEGPGSQLCAVNVAGTLVLDQKLPAIPEKPEKPLDYFLIDAIAELQQRAELCRGRRPALELTGKTIMLVDCGIRSGSSMQAAIGALRTRQPRRIIVAVPVASREGSAIIQKMADEFICSEFPEPFGHVGIWYKDFSRPTDHGLAQLIPNSESNVS